MKKNIKLKKRVALFLAVFVLLSVGSISMAQLKNANAKESTGTVIPSSDNNEVQNEIGSVEKSIKNTEDALSNLDNISSGGDGFQQENNSSSISNVGEMVRSQAEMLRILRNKSEEERLRLKNKTIEDNIGDISNEPNEDGEKRDSNESETKDKKEVEKKDNTEKLDKIEKTKSEETVQDSSEINKSASDSSFGGVGSDINIENSLRSLENTQKQTEKEVKSLEKITLKKQEKIIERSKTKESRAEASKDSDGDGISDYDEINIYGTDPFSADTDGDGYVDGAEILAGYDPKNSSSNAIVAYQDPKNSGVVDKSLFAVSKIVVKSKKIKSDSNAKATTTPVNLLAFKGKALPNSFVTLYIYSIPTVVTVKTDKDGNWEYTMDKEIENGDHKIYVAMTDGSGKVITKNEPIPFVKEALAVTVNQDLLSNQISGNKPSFFSFDYLYVVALVLIFLIGVVLTIIGIKLRFRDEKEKTEDLI